MLSECNAAVRENMFVRLKRIDLKLATRTSMQITHKFR